MTSVIPCILFKDDQHSSFLMEWRPKSTYHIEWQLGTGRWYHPPASRMRLLYPWCCFVVIRVVWWRLLFVATEILFRWWGGLVVVGLARDPFFSVEWMSFLTRIHESSCANSLPPAAVDEKQVAYCRELRSIEEQNTKQTVRGCTLTTNCAHHCDKTVALSCLHSWILFNDGLKNSN